MHRRPKSARELADELHGSPDWAARASAIEHKRLANVRRYASAAKPLLSELRAAGYTVGSVAELLHGWGRYEDAIPILVSWLPRINYPALREDVVRALSVPWARQALPALIKAFRTVPPDQDPNGTGLRWAIGNALEILADKSSLPELIELARDASFGRARQMVVLGLAKPRDPRAIETLVELLDDEDVAGYAAMALGRLRAKQARVPLERLASEGSLPWIRSEAAKALAKITE
jgi:HEAT repeat protein